MTNGPTTTVLGVDIDGVLNEHRTHFCRLLKLQVGKDLSPEAITVIPVHKIPNCAVTSTDEAAVFNWPHYWTEMPPIREAPASIARIRARGVAVWIYTRRPWPNPATLPQGRERAYWRAWHKASWWSWCDRIASSRLFDRYRVLNYAQKFLRGRGIYHITRDWLQQHGIPYDRLSIETASGSDAARFLAANGGRLHSFVEDNLDNARSLSTLCQRVYLIDQPYNRVTQTELPSNVMRVQTWAQIDEVY